MHLLLLTTTVACAAAAITVVVDGRTHVLEAASGDDASAVAANFVAAHSLDGGGVCGGSAACVSQQLEAALAAATGPPPPPPPPLLAPPAAVTEAGRALVVYAYHETPSARANLRFFLKHGLLPRAQADTVVVTHGCHTVDFPEGVAVVEDPNVGHDMGAYRCVFAVGPSPSHVPSHRQQPTNPPNPFHRAGLEAKWAAGKSYSHYVLLNDSVRGPFLPSWHDGGWLAVFTRQLGGRTRLVGTTINCGSAGAHLQSMFLVAGMSVPRCCVMCASPLTTCFTDAQGMALIAPHVAPSASRFAATWGAEVAITRAVIDAGMRVRSQLLGFSGGGHATAEAACAELRGSSAHDGDVLWPGEYGAEGIDVSPLEVVFFKTNRGVSPDGACRRCRLGSRPACRGSAGPY